MKNGLEKALFVAKPVKLAADVDRIYFGNEFCENLIPDLQSVQEVFSWAGTSNVGFTFVTPFVTNSGLNLLENILSFLDSQRGCEVVFNDWGVCRQLKNRFKNLIPVAGRLLTKQRRDPRMLNIFESKRDFIEKKSPDGTKRKILIRKPVPAGLFEHYQGSVVNVPAFQEYLSSNGIKMVEIDNLVWKMRVDLPERIGVSIYLPYGYISTSRMCGKLTLTYKACGQECRKYYFELTDPSLPVPIYGIGNSVFYRSKTPSAAYLKRMGVTRVVYQSRLAF